MEKWHKEKLSWYLPLKTTIESNGWSIHLFAVEVGARGFCARFVICCFHALGLHNSLVKSTIKALSRLSMESFLHLDKQKQQRLEITRPCRPGNIIPLPKSSEKTDPTSFSARNKLCKPVGFINKGNTC